jgi:hypothetical protein
MGQYYKVSNPDNFQYLSPSEFGDMRKLLEFGASTATLSGLALLLAVPSDEERGSWQGNPDLLGAWAGTRLVVGGDYADKGRYVPPEHQGLNLYKYVQEHGSDISATVVKALREMNGGADIEAAQREVPEYAHAWNFDAPKGMTEYLYKENASRLKFESFRQLHEFGWQDVGLLRDAPVVNFTRALQNIRERYVVPRRDLQISNLEKTFSGDGMRVEKVKFNFNSTTITWAFPLSVETVYEFLGVLAPKAIWGAKHDSQTSWPD